VNSNAIVGLFHPDNLKGLGTLGKEAEKMTLLQLPY
jgi:hypothetical protein